MPKNRNPSTRFWNYEETPDGEPAVLRLDGTIASESWWGDEVTPAMFRQELEAHPGDIVVYINSPGGDVIAASQIYTMLMEHNGEETGLGGMRTYSLEHVMATLLDDVLFGYHEVGGTGVNTRTVMQYILDRQTTVRWRLGTVDFNDYFQYHFENVSLLSALLSLGEVLTEAYTWEFNTNTTPWTVNLRKADTTPGCGIHYGRNLVSITKSMDATALVTRLYPLGYVTFHQLRHTHATLLFANNIDAVAVASRMGHKDASTTLRIYAHALKRRDADSAAAMQTILDRATAQPDAQEDAGPDK